MPRMTALRGFLYHRGMTWSAGPPPSSETASWAPSEELRRAVHAAGLGTWTWDRTSGTVTWGGRTAELYELAPDGFDGSLDRWLDRILDEDRAIARAAIDPPSGAEVTF